MDFWAWLVQSGLISGNATYYSSGKATTAEYTHALRTAINNLETASDPTARAAFYSRLHAAGGFKGDYNYYANQQATAEEITNLVNVASGALSGAAYKANPPAAKPSAPPPPPPKTPPAKPDPTVPKPPTPPPPTPPVVVDYRAKSAALFPWLPPSLLDLFARKWEDSGDVDLALAETRADPQYESFFPGIKRADGSLRMSESDYLGRIDGYKMALGQYGLNSSVFSNRFTEMIEGELEVQEFAQRLGAAYTEIITAMPAVKDYYSANYGVSMTDEAIFASFIDPDIGNAILTQRIAVSQIGGAGAAHGFAIDMTLADRMRQTGLGFGQAQEFFGEAAYQVPVLNTLAQRYDSNDPNVDIGEFSQAGIFADPNQMRRFNRLRSASSSSFTENTGGVATTQDAAVIGLSQR